MQSPQRFVIPGFMLARMNSSQCLMSRVQRLPSGLRNFWPSGCHHLFTFYHRLIIYPLFSPFILKEKCTPQNNKNIFTSRLCVLPSLLAHVFNASSISSLFLYLAFPLIVITYFLSSFCIPLSRETSCLYVLRILNLSLFYNLS